MGDALDRLVALTPRTPEASTVPEPFGKPSGPGLWRVKGMELPPYIQHVAHELVKKGHSESQAIGMAVGIVRDWAHGHDGHGHKTHPDVRAAAAKAMAQWESKRAKAHAHHAAKDAKHDVKTTGVAGTIALANVLVRAFQRVERGRTETVREHSEMLPGSEGALRELAGRVQAAHGTLAATHIHAAAEAVHNGRPEEAAGHLRAGYEAISAPLRSRGLQGDAEHQAAQGNLDAIRQHLHALRGQHDAPAKPGVAKTSPSDAAHERAYQNWKMRNQLPTGAGPNKQGDTSAVHDRASWPDWAHSSIEDRVRAGHTDSDEAYRKTLSKAGYSQKEIEDHFARRWADPEQRKATLAVQHASADVDHALDHLRSRHLNPSPVAGGV